MAPRRKAPAAAAKPKRHCKPSAKAQAQAPPQRPQRPPAQVQRRRAAVSPELPPTTPAQAGDASGGPRRRLAPDLQRLAPRQRQRQRVPQTPKTPLPPAFPFRPLSPPPPWSPPPITPPPPPPLLPPQLPVITGEDEEDEDIEGPTIDASVTLRVDKKPIWQYPLGLCFLNDFQFDDLEKKVHSELEKGGYVNLGAEIKMVLVQVKALHNRATWKNQSMEELSFAE